MEWNEIAAQPSFANGFSPITHVVWRERHLPLASFLVEIQRKKSKGKKKQENTLRRSLLRSFFETNASLESFKVSQFPGFLKGFAPKREFRRVNKGSVSKQAVCELFWQQTRFAKRMMLLFCVGISFTFWLCACEVCQVLYFRSRERVECIRSARVSERSHWWMKNSPRAGKAFFLSWYLMCILFLLQGLLQKKTKKGLLLGLYLLVSFLNGFFS